MKRNKEKLIGLLAILCVWTLFLFWDAFLWHISKEQDLTPAVENTQKIITDTNISVPENVHTAAVTENIDKISDSIYDNPVKPNDSIDEQSEEIVDLWLQENDINIQDTGFNTYDDIDTLQKIYEKNKDPEVLNLLISKLIQWYQFNTAKSYLANINIFQEQNISIKDYIYVYINTLSITDPTSISNFGSFLDEAKNRSLISTDDYIFYKWLVTLRNWDYNQALSWLSTISTPSYKSFVSQLSWAIANYTVQQWAPSYYESALISLTCLKNWYFTLANKLAIQASLKNEEYILPYQILSYSTFLTQDREKSIEYFYKLASLDEDNYERYNFYIGISYYRYWNYEKSIAALVPLINSDFKNDAYRYLLLDYENLWDKNKMVQIRQKQLWSNNLKESDFKYFFDQVFFIPFSKWEKFQIYREYWQMAYDFVSACYEQLWSQNATCLYGNVWIDMANSNRVSTKENLLYLADNYPQASVYQALWNYYKLMKDDSKAKTYLLKAVSMTNDSAQKNLIESILLDRGL